MGDIKRGHVQIIQRVEWLFSMTSPDRAMFQSIKDKKEAIFLLLTASWNIIYVRFH